MTELIVPSNIGERLSRETNKEVIYRKVLVNDYGSERVIKYSFDLMIDGARRFVIVELDRQGLYDKGTNVFPTIYAELLRKIKEL